MDRKKKLQLSVVIPKFNHKYLAVKNMRILHNYLSKHFSEFEIVLVDDGSPHKERVSQGDLPETVNLIQLPENRGKGFAIKNGMLTSSGECRIFTDLDLPYDLSAIPYSYELIKNGMFDFVAGDRTLFHSDFKFDLPLIRRLSSRIFSKFITLFVIGGVFDSQCGFKAFSGRLAALLFPLLTINRFSFDVEIYYLLLKYNIPIKRIPVRLYVQEVSTVNILRHSFEMAVEVFGIPLKWRRGKYFNEELKQLECCTYWEDNRFSSNEER